MRVSEAIIAPSRPTKKPRTRARVKEEDIKMEIKAEDKELAAARLEEAARSENEIEHSEVSSMEDLSQILNCR